MNFKPEFVQSQPARISDAEQQARIDLAACYRLVALYGWDDLIYARITLRVPGEPDHYLVNPFGLMFDEVTASCLIKVDSQANPIEPTDEEINPESFIPQVALHDARPDCNCVLHTHTVHGLAIAAQKGGLLPISQPALMQVGYHEYEGYPLREEEKARMREHLGSASAMVMANHGLITTGATVHGAFLTMRKLEVACQAQLLAQASGAELVHIPQKVLDYNASNAGTQNTSRLKGPGMSWAALLRRLDRVSPGYRD